MKDVEDFIRHFQGAENAFLHDCSFWFARILEEEFSYKYRTRILYAPTEGQFVTRIWDQNHPSKLYDIRGDVTGIFKDAVLESLEEMMLYDEMKFRYLMRNCKDFAYNG